MGKVYVGISGWRYAPWRGVYCYFDNDIKVKAPFDARRLIGKLQKLGAMHPGKIKRGASAPPLP